jgi:hypothetical protein
MERHQVSSENHRRVVLAYHGLPVVTVLALVGIFLVVFFFTRNLLLSGLAAAVPSAFFIWRWILAARQIERWGCLKCGEPFPKKMYWSYPPRICPRCGGRLDE